MGEKLIVGPINRGLQTNREAFNIDNDSFPHLVNAFQWRGRIRRKRGTVKLGRLTRGLTAQSLGTTDGAGALSGNIITILSLQTNASIVPSSITITIGAETITDNGAGVLTGTIAATGTINYATSAFAITGATGTTAATAAFQYYPNLPVMGLRDLSITTTTYPGLVAFDTVYAYNFLTTTPYTNYSVSFYKNPPSTGGYTAKTTWTSLTWNGENYQQFWTINYQGALWATNGIEDPFVTTNIGMQFKAIVTTTIVAGGPPAQVTLQITGHGLVVGDWVFVNEVATTTGINFQTGYVITVTDPNNVVVEFPQATIATNGTGGIAQYLTNRSDATKDCLRWYDGDPTAGTPPTPTSGLGWVNFCPPLSNGTFSISDLPAARYYLVGARIIQKFKDRILFFGPVVQTSAASSQIYLQDTIIFSQNGTPYYTASFTGGPSVTTTYTPYLVPPNQTAQPTSFWENETGFGGYYELGLAEPIVTVSTNEDVLILGTTTKKIRLVYTGNDLTPFNAYIIDSEYGDSSTFATINRDEGVISLGSRGIIASSQTQVQRIDTIIPDEVFQIAKTSQGAHRVSAIRDFINEWMYFTVPDNQNSYVFPTKSLFYNYRDDSWAIFKECYTCYGLFRKATGNAWNTLNTFTWAEWNDPWNSGESTLLNPEIVGGNPQGYVMIKDEGTGEDESLYIASIDANSVVTSHNHCLNQGDYIVISGALGTIGANVNGKIFSVANPSTNTFTLNPTVATGTYLGGGEITRMYVPEINSKQFPLAWSSGRKTRIGVQQYLFTKTQVGQVTLLIFLSMDSGTAYNNEEFPNPVVIVPGSSLNDALIYSTVLYTCPESTNLGLTAANINLQMPIAASFGDQSQIWHRMNTSLLGDTVQFGFTFNDEQMRDTDFPNQFTELEFHGAIIDVYPSGLLS